MSIGNALFGASQAKNQAKAIERSSDKATAAQLEMFNKQLELMKPYNTAGQSALTGLQQSANAQASPFSFDYQGYFNSPEYAALSQQAQQQTLAGRSATGGLRSGGSQVALSAIAPQLAQQAMGNAMNEYSLNRATEMDQYNRLMGLAGLGLGSAQQSASAAGQFGQQAGYNAMMTGQAQANKYGNYASIGKGLISDIGSAFNFGGF